MAIQKEDRKTQSLPGVPRKPGRPSTGTALSGAERVARHRAKVRSAQALELRVTKSTMQDYSPADLGILMGGADGELARRAWVEFGRRNGWLK